ncbi:AAA+ family ATPase [Neotabrizicola sp. sgz301269]|uniref:AAA+ family ATPase n=1 Tax=Neotabrizicola sp. sgz301269 TaxID=3276282 RepID=UPI003770251E
MARIALTTALAMAATFGVTLPAPLPVRAQTVIPDPAPDAVPEDEDSSLFEEGAKLMLRGLMKEMEPALDDMGAAMDTLGPAMKELTPWVKEMAALMGNVRNYEAPVRLDNGDILIRRKADAPPMPDLPGAEPEIAPPVPPGITRPGPNGEIDL